MICGRRRIVFVTHEESRTGAPLILLRVAQEMQKGHEVWVISRRGGSAATEFEKAFRDRLIRAAHPEEESSIEAHLNRLEPDLVYVNSLGSLLYARTARRLGYPTVFHIQEAELAFSYAARGNDLTTLAQDADLFIATSRGVAHLLTGTIGCDPERVYTIPPGVPVDYVQKQARARSPHEIRDELGSNEAEFLVVAAGCVKLEKGIDIFSKAAQRVRERGYPQVRFCWMGVVPDHLEAPERENEEEVTWLGGYANPYPVMRAADVIVSPSREESFGLTVAEAMALERPVCVFRESGGCAEILNNEGGIIIEDTSAEALTDVVIQLLEEGAEVRAAHGRRGLRRVQERYEAAEGVEQTRRIIVSMMR
jgi:glycosyltransferase involved in cell wall biosynthesis